MSYLFPIFKRKTSLSPRLILKLNMSRLFFGIGSILSGLDAVRIALNHGFFSNLWMTLFFIVFILAISVLGGATGLLILESIQERKWMKRILSRS